MHEFEIEEGFLAALGMTEKAMGRLGGAVGRTTLGMTKPRLRLRIGMNGIILAEMAEEIEMFRDAEACA
jgi:hypothetical protein